MSDFDDPMGDGLYDPAGLVEPSPTVRQRTYAALGIGPGPDRGRLVALLTVAGAIVVVAIALAVVSGNHHGSNKLVLTQGTSTTVGPKAVGLSPGVPSVTDTLPRATDATTAPPTSTSGPSTTTIPASTTTVPATSTSGPSTTAPAPECVTSALSAAVATDKAMYKLGATVGITVTVTNTSGAPCQITHWMAPIPNDVTITPIGSTAPVWQPAVPTGTAPPVAPKVLGPGESYVWTTVNWAQDVCVDPCTEAPGPSSTSVHAGTYTASPRNPPPGVVGPPAIIPIH